MLGYIADNGEAVVFDATGPGPAATHRRTRFLPDHAWQCKQIDEVYERSTGKWLYVGDWHTHPDGAPIMSWLDQRTLRAIARHSHAHLQQPLMLIGGGAEQQWSWKCHQFKSDRWLGLVIECDESDLRVFR